MYIHIYTYIYMYRSGPTNHFMHAFPIQVTQEKEKVVVVEGRENGGVRKEGWGYGRHILQQGKQTYSGPAQG